jgi:hypothetical protein
MPPQINLSFLFDDGPGICDPGHAEEEHGEELTGTHTPEIQTLDQARIRSGAGGQVAGSGLELRRPCSNDQEYNNVTFYARAA